MPVRELYNLLGMDANICYVELTMLYGLTVLRARQLVHQRRKAPLKLMHAMRRRPYVLSAPEVNRRDVC